jgi:hypothetical protein
MVLEIERGIQRKSIRASESSMGNQCVENLEETL